MRPVTRTDVFAAKTVTVTCETGCDTEAMVAALEESGFGGNVKE